MAAAARLQQALRTAVRRVASAAATADASAPVGFVGLGAMGSQMARNLAAKVRGEGGKGTPGLNTRRPRRAQGRARQRSRHGVPGHKRALRTQVT